MLDTTDEKPILLSGKYEVPWPHKIVTHGGVHPATKFQKAFKIGGVSLINQYEHRRARMFEN